VVGLVLILGLGVFDDFGWFLFFGWELVVV